MSGSRIIIIVLLVIVFFAAVVTWYIVQQNKPPSDIEQALLGNDPAGETSFSTVDGNPVSLATTLEQDSIVIVTVFASWCPSCAAGLRTLQQLAVDNQPHVTVLAINRDEPRVRARQYLDTVGDVSALTVLLNAGDRYYKDISGYAMPETIVYDQTGNIAERFRGEVSQSSLQRVIDSLRTESSP